MKDNYSIALQNAMARFVTYDKKAIIRKVGVTDRGETLETRFLGGPVCVGKADGVMTVDGENADFSAGMAVFDWLCDADADAVASGRYCQVSSLPGVLVSGNGLLMNSPELAQAVEKDPDRFLQIVSRMGGRGVDMGDLGAEIPVFPNLFMVLKFYFHDEEFPATVTFLWDEHILRFVRYETVYYIADALKRKLLKQL